MQQEPRSPSSLGCFIDVLNSIFYFQLPMLLKENKSRVKVRDFISNHCHKTGVSTYMPN